MSDPRFQLYSMRGRAARSLLARRGQMLVELGEQGRDDLALIRQTRTLTPLLMRDAAALTILGWARSAARLGGEFAEAGVFMGGSARLICAVKGLAPLHLFDVVDTLRGEASLEPGARVVREYFGEVCAPLEQVRALLSCYPEVHFHPGLLRRTTERVADRRFSFVHVDLDLGQGTAQALEFFYPRLLPGGVLIGDDYTLAPVREAFAVHFTGRNDAYAELPWGQVVVIKIGV